MVFENMLQYVFLENFLFIFFTVLIIFSSFLIILVNNSVYSVLFLILCFISSTGILFLLECEFIALLLLIIYVGAVAILFLFVIMMIDTKSITITKDIFKYLPVGIFIGGFLLLEVLFFISTNFEFNPFNLNKIGIEFNNFYVNWYNNTDYITDLSLIGQILYTHYLLQLLLTGLILLLSIIGTVSLTMRNVSIKVKKQVTFRQISRNYKNILLI